MHLPGEWLVFDIGIIDPDVGDRHRTSPTGEEIGHRRSG